MCQNIIVSEIALCHEFSSPPGWVSEEYLNFRKWHGFVYVIEGRALYQMTGKSGKKSFSAETGDLLYLSPEMSYITRCYEDTPFIHMTINFHLSDKEALSGLPTRIVPINRQRILQIFSQLVNEWTRRCRYYQVFSLSLLYELIGAVLEETNREHDSYRQKLRPALDYIEEHFCDPVWEEKLPELCGMSETYFHRLFKKVYKESALKYRSRLRIGKACDLLLSGMYTVEDVSAICGYEDPAYFSRAFKKIMGKSPSQYKKLKR